MIPRHLVVGGIELRALPFRRAAALLHLLGNGSKISRNERKFISKVCGACDSNDAQRSSPVQQESTPANVLRTSDRDELRSRRVCWNNATFHRRPSYLNNVRQRSSAAGTFPSADGEDVRLMQLVSARRYGLHSSSWWKGIRRWLPERSRPDARRATPTSRISRNRFSMRVWKSAKRYVPRAKFTTWLLKITRNLVFNELRQRKRHPVTSRTADRAGGRGDASKDEQRLGPDASLLKLNCSARSMRRLRTFPRPSAWPWCSRRYEEPELRANRGGAGSIRVRGEKSALSGADGIAVRD